MAERRRSATDADDDVLDTGAEDGARRRTRDDDGDDRPVRRTRDDGDDRPRRRTAGARRPAGDGGDSARDDRRLSAAQAGREGLRQVIELTGKDPETVTGVERSEDGWLVTVEVVEDRRIPSSTDILSTYEAEIDNDGELLSYRRVRRYSRGAGGNGGD